MKIATYDTNLTDDQWAYLKLMLPQTRKTRTSTQRSAAYH